MIDMHSPDYKLGYLAGYQDGCKDSAWFVEEKLKEVTKKLKEEADTAEETYFDACDIYDPEV